MFPRRCVECRCGLVAGDRKYSLSVSPVVDAEERRALIAEGPLPELASRRRSVGQLAVFFYECVVGVGDLVSVGVGMFVGHQRHRCLR